MQVHAVLRQLETKYPGLTVDFWNALSTKKLQTEDLGKTLEYAVCLQANTQFEGVFRYSVSHAEQLSLRLNPRSAFFQGLVHTGKQSHLYDFQSSDKTRHLSVKSCKSSWKVCPQVIGQTTQKKFRQAFGVPDNVSVKDFVCENPETMLNKYCETTFHSPVLFYNEKLDYVALVQKTADIVWGNLAFTHIQKGQPWKESTSIVANIREMSKTIGEFQLHAHRDCVKFRFDLKNLLALYPESFQVDAF